MQYICLKKKPVKFVVFDLVIHIMLVNLEMLIMNFIIKYELNRKNMKKNCMCTKVTGHCVVLNIYKSFLYEY